jgi:hypothetical protein
MSFALSVYLFVYLSLVVRLSLLSVGLSAVCLSVFLRSFCLSVCLSVCLLVCRSVRSVGLSVAAFVNTELRLCAQIGRARVGPVILACFETIIPNSILVY